MAPAIGLATYPCVLFQAFLKNSAMALQGLSLNTDGIAVEQLPAIILFFAFFNILKANQQVASGPK